MKKKAISILLLLCMVVSLFSGMIFTVSAEGSEEPVVTSENEANEIDALADDGEAAEPADDAADSVEATEVVKQYDFQSVFKVKLYVKANKEAGLEGDVSVSFSPLSSKGTLYLPGSADISNLFLSWDDSNLKVSKNGVVYESGTAPLAPETGTVIYNISKGKLSTNITIKTLKGASDVAGMFLNLDESLGTIDAMNSDSEHETQCFGSVSFDGKDYPYISMKGRGNSSWVFEKKPYNITFHKKADYDKKDSVSLIDGVKAKKWSLLANYLDNSLLRNKAAFDLAQKLGIGLDTRFVDVWMNGEYLGNYLLTPKKDYNTPKNGYILDNDHIPDTESGVQFKFPNIAEMPGKHNVINVEDIGDNAVDAGVDMAFIENQFSEAWSSVLDLNSENYQNYFDMDSWAKMYLMFEVSKTYDCYAGNIMMHCDDAIGNGKYIAGPVWDYDVSFGRTLHKFLVGITEPVQMNAEGWYNDSVGLVASSKPYSILQGLGMHASFIQHVAEVYNDYKWAFEELVPDIESQRDIIEASARMDNDRWGTHHIGTNYTVAPTTMSLLGTGKYKLNYEITVNWDSYVNNLKEFCTKRVMWLSDHLYAEYPVGSITQALSNQDSVVLKVALTAGAKANTYQWQSSANGKSWADIEGATNSTLKLSCADDISGIQYRCVVKNAGVDIYTTHGGKTHASAQTVLEPVTVNVTIAEDNVALREDALTLVLNGKEMGEFTFAEFGGGWSICDADGKYIAVDGAKLALSDTPFAWSFDNGIFTAKTKVSYTSLGKLLGLGTAKTAYLSNDGSALTVSVKEGAAAEFLFRYPILK